ncbi:MAG: ribonuclease III domain-containing protein [Calothrix sp. MO_167.B12]|nr:ribonuclease III domain-containing protein [Calothrix sp. MO_167.B12]
MTRLQNSQNQREQQIQAFIKVIGISDFHHKEALETALTHPSYIYESKADRQTKDLQEKYYRRLAHLGDAIIGAIVTDYLYEEFPDDTKGELTEFKQLLVDKTQLSEFASQLNLQDFCLLGKSLKGKHLDGQEKLFAEMFEAVLGAVYLELKRNFSQTSSWLIDCFIANAVDELLNDEEDYDEENFEDMSLSTRDYLDMIGLEHFPDGWAPGDDDD